MKTANITKTTWVNTCIVSNFITDGLFDHIAAILYDMGQNIVEIRSIIIYETN